MSGVRRGRAALSGGLATGPTACGGQSPATPSPSASSSPSSAASPSSTSTPTKASSEPAPVADPAHAVDPPGPRKGPLVLADLIIQSRTALDPDVIKRINALKSVKRSLVLSLGNVGIENRVINIPAVDPSTYRNFTVRESAELQEQWERAAG